MTVNAFYNETENNTFKIISISEGTYGAILKKQVNVKEQKSFKNRQK